MFSLNFRRNLESTFSKIIPKNPFNIGVRHVLREPLQPLKRCPRWVCVEDAVKIINSGMSTTRFVRHDIKIHL